MNAEAIPPFLQRLELGLEADARAIKRAYARELKKIDQETDLAGFQELRECYDIALRWAAWDAERKEQEAQASTPEPAPPPSAADGLEALDIVLPPPTNSRHEETPAPLDMLDDALPAAPQGPAREPDIDPEQLSLTAFERFTDACQVLGKGRFLDDVQLWEAELRRRLGDDELVNLEARTIFEARVAHLIAGEWQALNAPLFRAASTVFEWEGDPRRLQQFGYAGAFLYQATEEARLFEAQPAQDQTAQRQLLARLRQGDGPPPRVSMLDRRQIERMIERFPSLLTLQAHHEIVEQWRRQGRRPSPSVARAPVADTAPEPVLEGDTSKRRGFDKAWILFAVIAIVALLRGWQLHGASFLPSAYNGGQFMPPAAAPAPDADQAPDAVPASRRVDPGTRPARAAGALDQRIIDAIGNDIDYKYAKDAPAGRRTVKFEVFLDANGKVLGMNKRAKSIDPAWDKAVEAAIRRARPFPPEAGTVVMLEFGVTLTRNVPRPAAKTPAAQEPEAQETPAEEAGQAPQPGQ